MPAPALQAVIVQFVLLDVGMTPAPFVDVVARVSNPPGYLVDADEVVRPTETFSDAAGLVSLPLIPSSQYTWPAATYEVTYAGLTRTITVPDTGPVTLLDVLVP